MVDIDVTPRSTEIEPVNLGEFSYEFGFPKAAPIINAMQKAARIQDADEQGLASYEAQTQWLADGFGETQWAHIEGRLGDRKDPLDIKHIQALFQALFAEAVKDRPPTWRGDSSTVSPQAFKREVEQSPLGSMPDPSQLLDSVTS